MVSDDTGDELKLYVNRWLADDQDDLLIMREIAIPRPEQMPLPGKSDTPKDIINVSYFNSLAPGRWFYLIGPWEIWMKF